MQRMKDALKPKPSPPTPPPSKPLNPAVTGILQFREAPKPRTEPWAVLGTREGGGTCHGCWHFEGDGPEARRYKPEGKCLAMDRGAVPLGKPLASSVTWDTRACVAYQGWGTWCEKCGAAKNPNSTGCACIRPVVWR